MEQKFPTRHYSKIQEQKVARLLQGVITPNSGASTFAKGDVRIPAANMLIECKTVTSEKKSLSINKEWLDKLKEEAYSTRFLNSCLALSFNPEAKEVYFVIDEKMMKFLVEKLSDEEN